MRTDVHRNVVWKTWILIERFVLIVTSGLDAMSVCLLKISLVIYFWIKCLPKVWIINLSFHGSFLSVFSYNHSLKQVCLHWLHSCLTSTFILRNVWKQWRGTNGKLQIQTSFLWFQWSVAHCHITKKDGCISLWTGCFIIQSDAETVQKKDYQLSDDLWSQFTLCI